MTGFKKYAVFTDWSQRSEYWYFLLFNFLISSGLGIIDAVMGLFDPRTGLGLFSGIFSLIILIPIIAVGIRRFHDTDRSGWWLLLGSIPFTRAIMLIVFFAEHSKANENRFGPNFKVLI